MHLLSRATFALLLITSFIAPTASAQERVDSVANALIRRHGLEQSGIERFTYELVTQIGPRLTGTPELRRAADWAVGEFKAMGVNDARLVEWGPFGRGWTLERYTLQVLEPDAFPVISLPSAWSPDIAGPIEAEIVHVTGNSEAELARYRGQLKGKIVLVGDEKEILDQFEPDAVRRDADNLVDLASGDAEVIRPSSYQGIIRRNFGVADQLRFALGEEPLAVLLPSVSGDAGIVYAIGASILPGQSGAAAAWQAGAPDAIPQIRVTVEHFNRMLRLVREGKPVKVEIALDATFHDAPVQHNVIAEMPGTTDEVVMMGAHLDSWHGATGATDNASGVSVVMEAMRILKQVYAEQGRQPRRAIRAALWTGEEQGLLGSLAYVNQQFATGATRRDPPAGLKPAHEKISAYFNMDNGTGRFRGIYNQNNDAVSPIFRAWLQPFRDLGAETVANVRTTGTDHESFDTAGIPGFQFTQDPIAYFTQTWHTNMDLYDHLLIDDLKQAAVIMASFVYHTAERDELLPRKPLQLSSEAAAGTR